MANTFTPLFDEITEKHGILTSAVYGYIWRKCQMDRGVCDASFQTMADDLGVSRRTIVTHVKLLVSNGLVADLTPDADRKPHKYLVKDMQQTREANALANGQTREINAPGGAGDALALGQEMQQTREINAPKDTGDNKRDKEYIYVPLAHDLNAQFQTALSQVAKEPLAPGFNEKKYEDAAFALMGWDADLSQVSGFADYWKHNGWHSNQPSLTNIVNHWHDYLTGKSLGPGSNGTASKEKTEKTFTLVDSNGNAVDKVVINV